MADQQTIIIRKNDDHDDHAHHGGGWKVAYADFMTAMMAFFLMLWIISTADEQKLQGLAEFLTPAPMGQIMGGEGFLDGQVFGPDGVFSGIDGDTFQIQPPSFGREDPVSPPDDRPRDTPPQVVVEYSLFPFPEEPEKRDEAGSLPGQDGLDLDAEWRAQVALRAVMLDEVANEIAQAVAANLTLVELDSNLRIDTTPDGLLVQILDQEDRPMFASGSARIDNATRDLMQIIGLAVADLAYPLAITGHTDAVPFANSVDYGNWELSADRANATRRALIAAGVAPSRIARVSGLADTMPLNTAVPTAPENRRITMLLTYPEPMLETPARSGGAAGADTGTVLPTNPDR